MDARTQALALDRRLATEAATLRAGRAVPEAALRELRLAEIRGSLAHANLVFPARDIAKLAEGGWTPAGRALEQCNAVADYAAAAARIRALGRARPHRALLRLDEIVTLHALATRRGTRDRPGKWRATTARPLRSGLVHPPAWLIPRDMTTFVERFERGPTPERPLVVWLADAYERFIRIHPFATGNGRVARLILNLVLQRLGFPPVVLSRGEAKPFALALDRAGAGDLWPSALFFGRNLLRSVRSLEFARSQADETLLPLGRIVAARERAALYKAAQRGRLRTLRRGTSIFTSKTWQEEYRSSRAASGRPPSTRIAQRNRE